MFMGPFDQSVAWSMAGIIGPRRFLEKVWRMQERVKEVEVDEKMTGLESLVHKTIKKVSSDIEAMQFNTAVSALMILSNEFDKAEVIPQKLYEFFIQLLAPFAPHIADELWLILGHKTSIHEVAWVIADESKMQEEKVKILVQVNGKVRGEFTAQQGLSEAELTATAKALPTVIKWLEGKTEKKVIIIKNKLVNIVVIDRP
jgi:leucyl-tRNA synthetase